MRRFQIVTIDGEQVLLNNTTLNTLLSGEDQANDCLVIEEQNGYDVFDRSNETADYPLGTAGASGDLLVRVRVLVAPATSTLDIYDGPIATGQIVLSIPIATAAGTTYECGFMSKNGGFTCDDDANAGTVQAIGRFS